ncbi:MAG: hypothetical protein KGP29_02725 [Proteobacteria bacterium]|nr:hypothetical protein [Pseudomonadota bacterium]
MKIEKVKEMESCYIVNECIAVPKNSENSDYQQIQKWIAEGGVVEKEDLLAKAKLKKIAEIKSIRDQKNIEPITDFEAFLLDDEGNKIEQKSYFIFYTNRHQTNPASDPDSIISRALDLSAMPYFTKDVNGKKITIELTSEIAGLLRQRIAQRNNDNYKLSSVIEAEINNSTTIEEVETITLGA